MAFQMPKQLEELWCWAAVSVAVDQYFAPSSTLNQCTVAGLVFNRECCADSGPCNRATSLADALNRVGHRHSRLERPLDFAEIRSEIDAGRPVCVRIGWLGGGGHFVAIHGYWLSVSGVPHVDVADPLFPSGRWNYDDFVLAYQNGEVANGGGRWTHTYLLSS
ncbi:MAG: hypothetical protein JNN08_02545 [Bryobacterales bacterium]|nr:hypothetical protein [Bryobacterales bacterium]